MSDPREVELRSPGRWLHSIQCPTFVFEGTSQGNLSSLKAMTKASKNPKAHFYPVKGASHFSILAPVNKVIAKKLVADTGAETNLDFSESELNNLFWWVSNSARLSIRRERLAKSRAGAVARWPR